MTTSFTLALYEGTIGDNGLDPSNLYWLPSRNKTTNGVINAISGLTDWLSENHNVNNMNPLREADSFEKRLNYAAWFRRSHNDFLGHIKDRSISDTVNKVRSISGRQLMATSSDAIAFSEPLFGRFFLEGIGGASDRRVIVRNQLIILMMHFTGCRISDSLHLWVQDVHYDHNDEKKANVRLYHPEDGLAPDGWKSSKGSTNRAAYLREKYALTSRNRITGTQHVGWKNRISDHKDFFIQLHWFPSDVGRLFLKLWNEYLYYLADIKRRHPYAFISFERNFYGDPLTINAFTDAYNKALARIGESPSKVEGRSPHAHRHAMGRRLERAEVPETIIQKVLHHKSIASQATYTVPGISRVTAALEKGRLCLESSDYEARKSVQSDKEPSWETLIKTGFQDIDPSGLFSGRNPVFKKKKK